MSKLNRRSFLKLVGQGTAALGLAGIGAPGKALAAKAGSSKRKADDGEWEFYYPNRYDLQDAKVLNEFQAKLERIRNWGKVNIDDVTSGKLTSENCPAVSWNPYENNYEITLENMMQQAAMYVSGNRLFTDRQYAKKAGYKDLVAFPLVLTHELMPAMPKADGIGDYMVVSGHNDAITFHRPIYEGDVLFTIYDTQHCIDITPEAGSHYRTFVMKGTGRTFNQRGELVAEGANILKESFRRRKDPAKRNSDGAHAWESPDWWSNRPAHMYTDKDWDTLKGIWKKEEVREGTLYWDEVKVGEELTPHAYGPFLVEEETDMIYSIPQWASDIKRNVLDPKAFSRMVKNKQGIWVMPENLEKKPAPEPLSGAGAKTATPELANRDGRATIQNAVIPKFVAGMFYDWMGDEGFLQTIGWDIMASPLPGYPTSVIPQIPDDLRPALFDKFPFLDKVPGMKGKRPAWHALEGDIIIARAYVFDKYQKGGEYFVDIVFWCETVGEHLIEEGFATIRLPKK